MPQAATDKIPLMKMADQAEMCLLGNLYETKYIDKSIW
jgi:hypothetical protein